MKFVSGAVISAVFLGVLAGCGGDGKDGSGDGSGTDPARAEVTYWKDVAPVVGARCLGCHQSGGVAPFRLDSYAEAKMRAPLMAAAVQTRTMPPWLATDDGTCGSFQDSRWLTDAEIQIIARWAQQGAPEGTPRTDLPAPAAPATLGGTVAEVATPSYRPEPRGDSLAHADDYRCFLVEPSLQGMPPGPKFLTGYEVVPGNPALIHHALLIQVDGAKVSAMAGGKTNAEIMQALDAASPDRDGWPCYGLAGEGVDVDGVPVTWAPGMGVVRYPAGTGVPLTSETKLVMQVHYNLAQPALRGKPDVTRIRLRLDPSVERPGLFDIQDQFLNTIATGKPATLPPGQAQAPYQWETSYDEVLAALGAPYLEVHGVFPHMHGYGVTQRVEIVRGGAPQACAVDVKRWNFDWQLYYFYKQPLRIQPGDKVRVTCTYDTRKATEPVLPGWGTQNEMCFMGLYLVPPGM
jgi:hypothetical protein